MSLNRKINYLKSNWKTMLKFWAKERIGTFILFGIVIIMVTVGMIEVAISRKNANVIDYKDYVPREANMPEDAVIGEYKSVAKTDDFELFYEDGKGTIQVKDLKSGYVWKSAVDEEVYNKKMNAEWKQRSSSMFYVKLGDLDNKDAKPLEMYSYKFVDWMETTYLENGVSVEYGITTQGVFITIEYLLDENGFYVNIPHDGITEETQYIVTTLDIMPFFGAAGDEVDGYFVYPDGSGGVTYFNNVANRVAGSKAVFGSWSAYSNSTVSMLQYIDADNYERYVASIPAYGIKNNDNAVLVAVTGGAEYCGILGYVSGRNNVALNRINFQVYMRNVFDVSISNVSSERGAMTTGATIQRTDPEVIPVDKEIRYFMLSGDEANYSGMAAKYRDYLIETEQLNDMIDETEDVPLAIDFLMGVTEEQLVFEKYIKMTSLEDLVNIFGKLEAKGIDTTKVVLKSWTKGGELPPDFWPVASQIGGKNGLEELNDYLVEHSHNDVYLNIDLVLAHDDNGGFSTVTDVAYTGVSIPIILEMETSNLYLLSPEVAHEKALDLMKKLDKCNMIGISYEMMGRTVYPDYNERHPSLRGETIETWKQIYADTKAEGRPVATEGMNQYAYASVDYLTDASLETFGLQITDDSIPWVQMIISGCINYSALPGNLASDLDIQVLQWVEFGALPYFYLTQEDSVLLKETEYNDLFTSTYDVWEDRVVDTYNKYRDTLQCVYGKQMTDHEVLSENLRRLTYENGVQVYVNYDSADVTYDGVTVPAKGYISVGGGE